MTREEQRVLDAALALHRAYRDLKTSVEWFPYFSEFKLACEALDMKRGEDAERNKGGLDQRLVNT